MVQHDGVYAHIHRQDVPARMIVSCICCLSPLEVHLLPSCLTSPEPLLLEELERHTPATMMRERVVLLALLRVVGIVAVVVPCSQFYESESKRGAEVQVQ